MIWYGRFITFCIALTWLGMTLQVGVLIARNGYNLPRQDEWDFIPVITGHEDSFSWIVAKHYEHRYPVSRVMYLALHALTGQNFRAGMWLSLVLASVCAAILCLGANKIRGRCDWLNLLIPVLLLNGGHVENWTMGYQIVFTTTILWLTAFIAVIVWADRLSHRQIALACGLMTLLVAMGGGVGYAFAPGMLVIVLGGICYNFWMQKASFLETLQILILPLICMVYLIFNFVDFLQSAPTRAHNDSATFLRVLTEFWTIAWGGAGQFGYPLPGVFALAVVVESLLLALIVGFIKPSVRMRMFGFAALLLGSLILSFSVAYTRSVGNESRYAIFGGFGLVIALFVHSHFAWKVLKLQPGHLMVTALAVWVAIQDWRFAEKFTETYAVRTSLIQRDVRLGLPINIIAERHVIYPTPSYQQNFELLYAAAHRSLRGAKPVAVLKITSIMLPPDARLPSFDGKAEAPKWELRLAQPLRMDALRLVLEVEEPSYREVFRIALPENPDEVAGLVTMWVVPGRRTAIFRIESTLDRIIIQPLEPTRGFKILKCEAINYE
jgi:hypothetical protein